MPPQPPPQSRRWDRGLAVPPRLARPPPWRPALPPRSDPPADYRFARVLRVPAQGRPFLFLTAPTRQSAVLSQEYFGRLPTPGLPSGGSESCPLPHRRG